MVSETTADYAKTTNSDANNNEVKIAGKGTGTINVAPDVCSRYLTYQYYMAFLQVKSFALQLFLLTGVLFNTPLDMLVLVNQK